MCSACCSSRSGEKCSQKVGDGEGAVRALHCPFDAGRVVEVGGEDFGAQRGQRLRGGLPGRRVTARTRSALRRPEQGTDDAAALRAGRSEDGDEGFAAHDRLHR
jgi:hypothetical protein